ncbi:MAG: sigma-70 family RNA polymerase sigma factor [Planctomycetes bacterium]|nr:sigma-70 family RNA polymerase sigma factor [Planctomycetota bacterium]
MEPRDVDRRASADELDYAAALAVARRFVDQWHDPVTLNARDDLAQEAVVEAWRRRDTMRDARRLPAFVRTVVRRMRARELQRHGRHAHVSLDAHPDMESLAQHVDADDSRWLAVDSFRVEQDWLVATLRSALRRMRGNRGRLVLAFYAGESTQRIARRFTIPPHLVKCRLHRGRRRLRADCAELVRRAAMRGDRSVEHRDAVAEPDPQDRGELQ